MKQKRPRFVSMWALFTTIYGDGSVSSVGKTIGGKVQENIEIGEKDPSLGFGNACAIRMSYCLNYSGVLIPHVGQWETVSGNDKKRYIFRVVDLINFLNSAFGKADKTVKNPNPNDFSGMRGIFVFM